MTTTASPLVCHAMMSLSSSYFIDMGYIALLSFSAASGTSTQFPIACFCSRENLRAPAIVGSHLRRLYVVYELIQTSQKLRLIRSPRHNRENLSYVIACWTQRVSLLSPDHFPTMRSGNTKEQSGIRSYRGPRKCHRSIPGANTLGTAQLKGS